MKKLLVITALCIMITALLAACSESELAAIKERMDNHDSSQASTVNTGNAPNSPSPQSVSPGGNCECQCFYYQWFYWLLTLPPDYIPEGWHRPEGWHGIYPEGVNPDDIWRDPFVPTDPPRLPDIPTGGGPYPWEDDRNIPALRPPPDPPPFVNDGEDGSGEDGTTWRLPEWGTPTMPEIP